MSLKEDKDPQSSISLKMVDKVSFVISIYEFPLFVQKLLLQYMNSPSFAVITSSNPSLVFSRSRKLHVSVLAM